jgi:hypothetical protein
MIYRNFPQRKKISKKSFNINRIIKTRILGAYCPIIFALWVWVGFRASWRSGTLFKKISFVSIPASCSKYGHSQSEKT